MILILLADKVCVKDEGGIPIYGAYVKTNKDWSLTGGDGCADVKRGDSLYVSRIGYLPYRGPFKEEVTLISSPIKLHPVEVKVKSFTVENGDFYQPYGFSEVGVSTYGTSALSKLNIRGFDRKRYEVFFEGFLISDQSNSEDHPMGIIPTNENLGIIKGSSSGIFGGNSMGGAVIIESEKPHEDFKPKLNLSLSNLGIYTDIGVSKGGGKGFDIVGDLRGLEILWRTPGIRHFSEKQNSFMAIFKWGRSQSFKGLVYPQRMQIPKTSSLLRS